VNQAKDVVQRRLVAGIALETYKLDVDDIEALGRFREEFAEKIIHDRFPQHAKFRALGK
jgi:hypothetical protein